MNRVKNPLVNLTASRRSLVILVVTVAVAVFAAATSANHSWGSYHWARTSNPFTIKLGDNVSSAWDSYLAKASSDWTSSTVLNTTVVPGNTGGARRCPATTGMVEVCADKYGQNGWLGLASISVSGSHITSGTVKMNDTYYAMAQYNTPAWRQMVMCQEIGHTFGLDHQDEIFNNYNLGTCMDYTNDPDGGGSYGPSNVSPNAHDYDQLVTIYSHTDSSTTIGQSVSGAPAAMGDIDFEGPGQWGREIRKSADGRLSLYELDFGNGHKVFTFVTWALEAKGEGRTH
ncbi:MAG: hypothetical protein LC785_00040 [Acidobacteria bacterium]|nr:hypothetical protein [Acidobacteriota bacterium]MCA1632205.1 hypothetical protein [Acidobacteriota bacterium]MCA1640385.1 hypothetical protein [Acidobacteriota bacterium]